MRASSSQWPVPVSIPPDKLAEIQAEFSREWVRVATEAQQGSLQAPTDRRFSTQAWVSNPWALLGAHAYLLSAKALYQLADAADTSEAVRNRLRFSIMQWVEAVSPSNFLATNPDVQRALIETQGQSLCMGITNLLGDLQKGRLTQCDETQFELGRNVAATEGAVVYENRLMQVIQYASATEKVYKRPLLIVPPCINKFYILDLQPGNSFVRHAVQEGFTVFMISWRNPVPGDSDGIDTATWDDYLTEGVLEAIDVAADVSGQKQVNALGFCVGGTMLASALAVAKAQGKDPVSCLTLLTTLLDFEATGVLDVFVDEFHAQMREQQLGTGGLMSARELSTTFSFLRPGELVWNYVVGNYLKGEQPAAFDLLYWNSDGTNLPGPFFAWYFRNTYLENKLKLPGKLSIGGAPLDLTSLTMPAYIYGSREDHIVPWHAAYASTRVLQGPQRFVLGASGHIAGVINPPAKKRRSYWAIDADAGQLLPDDPTSWLDAASERTGSWWPDWTSWLTKQSGVLIRSRSQLGSVKYPPIEPAPGRYVRVRA